MLFISCSCSAPHFSLERRVGRKAILARQGDENHEDAAMPWTAIHVTHHTLLDIAQCAQYTVHNVHITQCTSEVHKFAFCLESILQKVLFPKRAPHFGNSWKTTVDTHCTWKYMIHWISAVVNKDSSACSVMFARCTVSSANCTVASEPSAQCALHTVQCTVCSAVLWWGCNALWEEMTLPRLGAGVKGSASLLLDKRGRTRRRNRPRELDLWNLFFCSCCLWRCCNNWIASLNCQIHTLRVFMRVQ